MSTVSVRRVAAYDPQALYLAVCAHLEALGVAADLTPDTHVLLKPNLLFGRDPSLAVTTHPALLRAIAKRLGELGVTRITLADSPGGRYTPAALRKVYATCGLTLLSDVLCLNEDTAIGEKGGFSVIQAVLNADYIINCPKLKTHGLTVMSAGVKNLFGCIPGLQKPEWHMKQPTLDGFTAMLLRLCGTVAPQLTLLDAVDCMEGNGPSGGDVRPMGYTLCSRDVYALDEVAAELMAVQPNLVPTLRLARQNRLCMPETIEKTGDALLPAQPPFRLPDSIVAKERLLTPNGMFHRLFGRRKTYPYIVAQRCIGCGRCGESCPRHLIDVIDRKAVITRKGCISCFCCQEMCPERAIDVTRKRPR